MNVVVPQLHDLPFKELDLLNKEIRSDEQITSNLSI